MLDNSFILMMLAAFRKISINKQNLISQLWSLHSQIVSAAVTPIKKVWGPALNQILFWSNQLLHAPTSKKSSRNRHISEKSQHYWYQTQCKSLNFVSALALLEKNCCKFMAWCGSWWLHYHAQAKYMSWLQGTGHGNYHRQNAQMSVKQSI